eukprot:comp14986_c0_seq1/m.22193 comp14986_c0_seq1/g.22193  ORF comp14986_c0_seq1/g.22193 comp14986_c0_seq1/m.22193 type:complete len:270 (-) comp14986_c0_seq1:61-870(-)
MGGKSSKIDDLPPLDVDSRDFKKNLAKRAKHLKLDVSQDSQDFPERAYVRETDNSPHVVASVVCDLAAENIALLKKSYEIMNEPSKSPREIEVLHEVVEYLEVLLFVVHSALEPLGDEALARIDRDVADCLAIISDELKETVNQLQDARTPDSTISLDYIGYVATYMLSTEITECANRLEFQTGVLDKKWDPAFRDLVTKVEKKLTLDDERLAKLENFAETHGQELPKEYYELVKIYDDCTKQLLDAIHNNSRGTAKLKKLKAARKNRK